uniref:2-isopropylmalate synthase n=1 Tax=Compsopogon caeruleus TaxID=31354 RepID=A0A7S1TCN3_9RHOD
MGQIDDDAVGAVISALEGESVEQDGVGFEPPPIICGLARATSTDIDRCWNAIRLATFPRIHCFATGAEMRTAWDQSERRRRVKNSIAWAVAHAKSLCADVEFSASDATRADPEFLYEVLNIAVESGATTLNIADTAGFAMPSEFGALVTEVRRQVRGIQSGDVILSVHTHNDLGLATANSITAIENGARQVECTLNGIGERAGNTALEEIVLALDFRRQYFNRRIGRDPEQAITCIRKREVLRSCRMLAELTGSPLAPNKAIVGSNACKYTFIQGDILDNEILGLD